MRILIIEDHAPIVANLYAYLEQPGYVIDSAANGYAALALIAQYSYDVLIMDIGLPGLNGLQLCQRVREELKNNTPILMLTARDTEADKIAGFESGADDYLVKPFSMAELSLRLKALVRRTQGNPYKAPFLSFDNLSLDFENYQVLHRNQPINLTKTEMKILECLMRQAPHVVSRETLEMTIWGKSLANSNALRTHIHGLRKNLDEPDQPSMLRTVSGVGYQLVCHEKNSNKFRT